MEINKDTYKKIRNLILFTILVIFAIFKLDIILNALGYNCYSIDGGMEGINNK